MPGLLVAAIESAGAAAAERTTRYPVRLGPLRFECVVGELPEALGDKLDAVGATLVAGERSTRAAQITLPVAGSYYEVDDRDAGLALRRQVRALLNNAAWRPHGLYFEAGWDPETAAWLAVGGGQLTDEGRGVNFGDWQLALSDAFLIGRPSTHRRARRLRVVDRAAPGVPLDTRRLLYSTDLAGPADGPPPSTIPGFVTAVTGYGDREPPLTVGPAVAGHRLWTSLLALGDAEVVSWRPASSAPVEREATTEDVGSVRVWAADNEPWVFTSSGDTDPDLHYGWERIVGDLDRSTTVVAIDNGWTRLRWLGSDADGGLLLERAAADGKYSPVARVLHTLGAPDVRSVEITAERAVVSWRTGGHELRTEIRRGWAGPRLEVYAPRGLNATLSIAAPDGARTAPATLVDRIATGGSAVVAARSHAAVAWTAGGGPLADQTGRWTAPRVFVLQTDLRDAAPASVRALARWDVRADPTLIAA